MPGILRSVSTRSGANSSSLPSALKPSAAVSTDVALVAQQLGERGARVDLVVDDQDASLAFHDSEGSFAPGPNVRTSARIDLIVRRRRRVHRYAAFRE